MGRDLRLVYTVTEAAELLGIGRSTAYEIAARGELATVRIGCRTFVTRPTLTGLIGMEPPLPGDLDAARQTRPAPPAPASTTASPATRHPQAQPSLPFRI